MTDTTQRNLYACHKQILKGCLSENKTFMVRHMRSHTLLLFCEACFFLRCRNL